MFLSLRGLVFGQPEQPSSETGASYDNRFISVVTIGDRKIVQWRDYMDSLTAMTALSPIPAMRWPTSE